MKNEVLKRKSRQLNWCVSNFESDDISPYKKMKYFSEGSHGQPPFTMITKITETASPKIKRF